MMTTYANLTDVLYRERKHPQNPQIPQSVLRVFFEVRQAKPDSLSRSTNGEVNGNVHHSDLLNTNWSVGNPTLQFMALYGLRPRDMDVGEYIIPVVHTGDNEYELAASAMSGGEAALEQAEWFNPDIELDDDSDDSHGPHGGGSPDPSTGNRGAVDMETGVELNSDVSVDVES